MKKFMLENGKKASKREKGLYIIKIMENSKVSLRMGLKMGKGSIFLQRKSCLKEFLRMVN